MRFFRSLLALILFSLMAVTVWSVTPTTVTVSWTPPTTYTDGSSIAAGTPITYNVYTGAAGAETRAATVNINSYVFSSATLSGVVCIKVSSVVAGVESAPTPERCVTVAMLPKTPAVPTGLAVTTK